MGAPLLVVTPWYPRPGSRPPLAAAVEHITAAAAHAGADVTVVHLVPAGAAADDAAGAPGPTVRRVPVAIRDPGAPDPEAVDAVARALHDRAADLLGSAAVVHAHGGLPTAAALVRVLPEGTRMIVSDHLASLAPLLTGHEEPAGGAEALYRAVLARADAVLVPSEALTRRLAVRFGRDDAPALRVDVLPYLVPRLVPRVVEADPAAADTANAETRALPLTRWLLLGSAAGAVAAVRALAADALAGAPTTLTVVGDGDSPSWSELAALAGRLGVGDRLLVCPPEEVLDRLAGAGGARGFDLVVDLDPLGAAEPVLPVAFAAEVPAVLARAPGPEEVLDEVAATGVLRLLPPGAGVVGVLEAVADLRRAVLERRVRPGVPALPAWRTGLSAGARLLARHYGEALVADGADGGRRPWPRVLLVDLAGAERGAVGGLGRWIGQIGGEALVVTATAPPPCANVPGAVTVDLRPVQRALARPLLRRVRRRLPRAARPALDRAIGVYRSVRPGPTLVDATLEGPLAPGRGPSPGVDAAVAADPAGAELARRWTGQPDVLPAQADALVRRLAELDPGTGGADTVSAPAPARAGTTERS